MQNNEYETAVFCVTVKEVNNKFLEAKNNAN